MLQIVIPGYNTLHLDHLVLDYNGTLACAGVLIDGVAERLGRLATVLRIHVVTADTFGTAAEALAGLPCKLTRLPEAAQDVAKLTFVEALGVGATACIGNGRNDRRMLAAAALGIAVLEGEGVAVEALQAADVLTPGINAALDLLLEPKRLVATLRS